LGSQERVEFTALGDAVNIAYSLEAQARPNRLFVDQSTYSALSGEYTVQPLNQIFVKGHAQLIQVYEITAEQFEPRTIDTAPSGK
jgi:class 3 adenylate cyclase